MFVGLTDQLITRWSAGDGVEQTKVVSLKVRSLKVGEQKLTSLPHQRHSGCFFVLSEGLGNNENAIASASVNIREALPALVEGTANATFRFHQH